VETTVESLIRRFGLLAIFVGGATEGDGTLVVTGALAHLGYFGFALATGIGALGAFAIDCSWYFLGRVRGSAIRSSRLYAHAGATVERLIGRLGVWQLVIARFIPGARIPSMIFWGMQGAPLARFAILDSIGCSAWAAVLSALGYAFSGSLALLAEDLERTELHVLVIIAAVMFALGVRVWARRSMFARRRRHDA
jgi:membrane protein DedA with SNARE-associated domain